MVAQLEAALSWLQAHDDYWVVAHERPDGDAIASTLAMGRLLHHLGKHYQMVNQDFVPPKFLTLPTAEELLRLTGSGGEEVSSPVPAQEPLRKPQALILVDCADEWRAGPLVHDLLSVLPSFNVDHHPTNTHFAQLNLVQSEAAATAQIIYDLYQAAAVPFTKESATLLYTGILTDTGGFRHSNTTPAVMERAAHLLQYGVKPSELAHRFLEAVTPEHLALLQRALRSLQRLQGGKIAVITVTHEDVVETGACREDLNGIVNYGVNLVGTEVAVLFHEEAQGIKVSFRSKSWLDVAQIASQFGGGGHVRAAGCTMAGSLQQVKKEVLATLEGQFANKE